MRVLLATFPVVLISMLSLAFSLGRGESEPKRAPLANRIQTVCKKGFHAYDWQPVEGGLVYVVCESSRVNQYGLPLETYGLVVKR